MGNRQSGRSEQKRNKNHNRQKTFRFGLSFGRNDLNLEGHVQLGYKSTTSKVYGPAVVVSATAEQVPDDTRGEE